MAGDVILRRRDGPVGWLIFNRPEKFNAVSLPMLAKAEEALAVYADDPEIKVVVLRGEGEKAFISGADIETLKAGGASDGSDETTRLIANTYAKLAEFPKPTIAMIHGYCLGGGVTLAACCDVRYCDEGAKFGVPAARLGLGYDLFYLRGMVDLVGPAFTKEILLTARRFSAVEAKEMGLVNRVFSADALGGEVLRTATAMAENAPLTMRAAKAAVHELMKDPESRDEARIERMVRDCFESADFREGRQAFIEKRTPRFTGR